MSNLPPGCRVTDIPGNRPEDHAREKLEDRLLQVTADLDLGDLADFVEFVEDDGVKRLLQALDRGELP